MSCAPAPAAGPTIEQTTAAGMASAVVTESTSVATSVASSSAVAATSSAASSASTVTTAAPAASAPQPQKQVNRDDYYYIRNIHKRPMRDGPRAGWDLVVRKADGCLLVIAQHRDSRGRSAKETPIGATSRFSKDAETLKVVRERLSGDGLASAAIAKIMRKLDRCPLGHRTLVSIKRKQP